MSGSHSGTYSISPKHMMVECPSNCDDSAIDSRGNYDLPLDQPTEMTYFIYRCRGSAVFREIVDAAWDCGCAGVEELPFELVLDFDAKINRILSEIDAKYEKAMSRFPIQFDPVAQKEAGMNRKMVLFSRQLAMVSKTVRQNCLFRIISYFGLFVISVMGSTFESTYLSEVPMAFSIL